MNKIRSWTSVLLGVLALAALAMGLAWLLGPQGARPAAQRVSPLRTPIPAATPTQYVAPTAPSEDWPTLTPYPTRFPPTPSGTLVIKELPQEPAPILSFPTPMFPPTPAGERPAELETIWFPYFPSPDSQPLFQAVLVDAKGQRWGQSDRLLDFTVPKPEPGPDPGPILTDLHVSSNGQWVIADFAYVGSQLIDMSSGRARPLTVDTAEGEWHFWDYHPDGQFAIVSMREVSLALVDLTSRQYDEFDLALPEVEGVGVAGIAYSPDGRHLADVVVYHPIYEVRENWSVEIAIRTNEQGIRTPVLNLADGYFVVAHSLSWSPDGRKLICVVGTIDGNTQLWMTDIFDGTSEVLAWLAESTRYNHPAVWSPDGRYIAVIKVAPDNHSNVYLIDLETGKERQLTYFTDQWVSHLRLSPDGQKLAFTVSTEDYGEIWVTNLDGTLQYPVAGPALPNAPFVWLPTVEGGR